MLIDKFQFGVELRIRQNALNEVAILVALGEGDRKAVARSSEVAGVVIKRPELLTVVIDALGINDQTTVAHAAHALNTVVQEQPQLLEPHADALVRSYNYEQWEVLEQLGKILPKLPLTDAQVQAVADRSQHVFYHHTSAIARVCALQCFMDMAAINPSMKLAADDMLQHALTSESKALQARARKLLP